MGVRIIRIVLICAVLGLYPFAVAAQDALRTLTATVPQSTGIVMQGLTFELPGDVQVLEQDDGYILSYAGLDMPTNLTAFLTDAIPTIQPDVFAPGMAVNVSVALIPTDSGTEIRLMMMGNQVNRSLLPPGAEVLLMDGAPAKCSGQMVLSHDGGVPEITRAYVGWASAAGFDLTDASDASMSFFIGHRPTCSIFLYIQPDPDVNARSVVVVRYVED